MGFPKSWFSFDLSKFSRFGFNSPHLTNRRQLFPYRKAHHPTFIPCKFMNQFPSNNLKVFLDYIWIFDKTLKWVKSSDNFSLEMNYWIEPASCLFIWNETTTVDQIETFNHCFMKQRDGIPGQQRFQGCVANTKKNRDSHAEKNRSQIILSSSNCELYIN